MEKQFPLVLNITKPIDPQNHIRFFRGDNVQFIFSYIDGEGNPPSIISEAVKLRVYAKKIYADGVKKEEMPIFSGEFDNKEVASFSSLQTAGDAGNYLMAVILLDALGNVITAQGVYLDLLENGYAGVYQPSPDFRDEVLDALAQAQAAAANAAASASSAQASLSAGENLYQQGLQQGNAILADCNSAKTAAQSSATSAEGSAQSAEVSAGIAAQQASDAESAKDAAVAAKNTATTQAGFAADSADNAAQSATTAQQAAAQAVEITDPEGWRTDTRAMIARLALTKSDSGTLYFTGGAATATPNLAFDTLSVLFKTDFDFSVAQTTNVLYPFYIGTTTQDKYILVQFGADNRLRINTGNGVFGSFSRSDIAALVGDGVNALAFVFKKLADGNAQVSLFVNGVSVQNLATATVVYPALESFLSINKWGSSSTSAGTVGYSDFRIFNFDVSATDAPYSLADYQAGKRLPPFLSSGVYIKSNPDVQAQTTPTAGNLGQTTQGTLAKSDSGYTLTLTSASTRRFWFKFDKKYPAGTWFRVRRGALTWDGMETTGSRISQTALNVGTSTTSPYTVAVSNLPTSEAVDVVFQTPIEANMVGFIVWNGADVPTATISIPYFEFEVLGANVALENYTIARNVTTKLIKDASGNGNDATVSGDVAGDMDAGIAAFVDELKTQISQQS